MGILFGFAPWIVYWTLVGNVPFLAAALVALGIAIAGLAIGRITRTLGQTLEFGSVATFLIVTAVTVLAGPPVVHRWALTVSIAGILLVTLVGVLTGTSFVHEFAAAGQPPGVVDSDVFGQITSRLTWIWVAVFGGMTVSSSIPPIGGPMHQSRTRAAQWPTSATGLFRSRCWRSGRSRRRFCPT